MNITNFAKKVAEKPVFKTRIKSDEVKIPEMIIGYFLAPFCAMFANSIFGAYLNRYYVDVLGWTKFGAFATLLPIVSVIFVVLGNLMIGQWIDNTRSTQGKARPYLILAAPMLIVAIILMFMTPNKGSNAIQMIWIAVSYNLYYALAYPFTAHTAPWFLFPPEILRAADFWQPCQMQQWLHPQELEPAFLCRSFCRASCL